MVGGAIAGSSRRCDECRRRRKKCDLQEPQCLRCRRSGIRCSGPTKRIIFVNRQQTSFEGGTQRRALLDAYQTRTSASGRAQHFYEVADNDFRRLRTLMETGRWTSTLPRDDAILSNRYIFLEPVSRLLVEQFKPGKKIFSGDRARLPAFKHYSTMAICIRAFLLLPDGIPFIEASRLALLALYYGRLHANADLARLARYTYLRSLQQCRYHLERTTSLTSGPDNLSIAFLCASIALHFFEQLSSIDILATANQTHIDGALQILHLCGPESMRTLSATSLIFSGFRGSVAYLSILRRQPTFLSERSWLRGPFPEHHKKTGRDRLLDLALELPDFLKAADTIQFALAKDARDATVGELTDQGLHLLVAVGELRKRFELWLSDLRASISSPLFWPRSRPSTSLRVASEDQECRPKLTTQTQLWFVDSTVAGLLSHYWAFLLELHMTTLDLQEAIFTVTESRYVRKFLYDEGMMRSSRAATTDTALLILEAQPYLSSCLEGMMTVQLPLKIVGRYVDKFGAT